MTQRMNELEKLKSISERVKNMTEAGDSRK